MGSIEHAVDDLLAVESRMEDLLGALKRLREENRSLRASQESLVAERANLVAKNEQARTRVEAMIARLKSLEQST